MYVKKPNPITCFFLPELFETSAHNYLLFQLYFLLHLDLLILVTALIFFAKSGSGIMWLRARETLGKRCFTWLQPQPDIGIICNAIRSHIDITRVCGTKYDDLLNFTIPPRVYSVRYERCSCR